MNRFVSILILLTFPLFCYTQQDTTHLEKRWELSLSFNSVEAQIDQPLLTTWGWAWTNLTVYTAPIFEVPAIFDW